MGFQLSETTDRNKVFLVRRNQVEERFDPNFYKPYSKKVDALYELTNLKRQALIIRHPPEYKRIYADTGIQLLRSQNVRPEGIDINNSPVFLSTEVLKENENVHPEIGDVLVVRSGVNAGDTAAVEVDLPNTFIGADTLLIRFSSNVVPKFVQVFFSLKIGEEIMQRHLTGATNKHISPYYLGKIKIPLPPLNIQKQIIDKMNIAYSAKKEKEAKAQRLLDSIDDYLLKEIGIDMPEEDTAQSRIFIRQQRELTGGRFDPFYYQQHYKVLYDVFKGRRNIKPLSELLQKLESGSRPKGGVSNIQSGVLSLGGEHVNNQCEIEVNNPKYIPVEFHNSHKSTETHIKDLLLVKDGATTGKIGVIDKEKYVGKNINEHIFLMRAKETINPIYLLYYLNSPIGNLQIKREITGGTVTGITRDVVKKLQIIIPNLKKQTEIANQINNIRNQTKQLQQQAKVELERAKEEVEKMILGDTE